MAIGKLAQGVFFRHLVSDLQWGCVYAIGKIVYLNADLNE